MKPTPCALSGLGVALPGWSALALVVGLAACAKAPPGLTGTWKSERTELRITQQGATYAITASNPGGMLSGDYTGEFRGETIALKGPLAPICGDAKYEADSGRLFFCGETFTRQQQG